MLTKKRNSIILALVILNRLGHAQSLATYSFDYNTFLSSVKENNPLAGKANNNLEYGKAQLNAAKGNFDPQLYSTIDSKQFNSYNYFTSGIAELKQPLYTSQYLKVGYQYGQGMYLNPEMSTPVVGLPYVGVEASLLQGLMFDKRRAQVVKAKSYTEFFNAEQKIQMNDILFAASSGYMDALYSKKVNSLYAYFANLALQRLKGITDLSVIGERPAIDTTEAAIFLQGRLLDRQAGEIELIKRYNDLFILNSMPVNTSQSLMNTNDSLELVYNLALKSLSQTALGNQITNPIVSQYLAKQKILDTEMRLKREMIKPVLDVSYNFLNAPNAVVFPTMNFNNYKWGATFSFPLFLRKPRNEYKMARVDAKNNELETINKQNQISFKRQYILDAITITSQQIANAERSATYSKLLVEAERLKFNNGESSLFLLNSRESKWLETELKLAEYKLKFIKSFIELTYINGDLKYEL